MATSKPQIFAEQILEHFPFGPYFQGVCGSNLDGSRCRKAEVIDDILNTLPPNASAVMVGDRMYDVAGAKEGGNSLHRRHIWLWRRGGTASGRG
ncbi:MAG: HAD family hydrolase [Clostridia bacterium]